MDENIINLLQQKKNIESKLYFFSNSTKNVDIKNQIVLLTESLQNVNNKLRTTCQHDYVEDWIDIDPDKTIKIRYCTICEDCHNI